MDVQLVNLLRTLSHGFSPEHCEGAEVDEPEGSRYLRFSATVAAMLREKIDEHIAIAATPTLVEETANKVVFRAIIGTNGDVPKWTVAMNDRGNLNWKAGDRKMGIKLNGFDHSTLEMVQENGMVTTTVKRRSDER
jgi:hypothetical protein